jgi:hypothetical protein
MSTTGQLPIREQRIRRCGQCRQQGHDRRSCPDPIQVERRRVAAETRLTARASLRERLTTLDERVNYTVYNDNPYPVHFYWGNERSNSIKYLMYIGPMGMGTCRAKPHHRIVAFPVNEFNYQPETTSSILLSECTYFIVADYTLRHFHPSDDIAQGMPDNLLRTPSDIHIIKDYVISKTELEQWKECGLKSLFLLKELERMGGKQYGNLEPILDMVQDISLPSHTELDKELAGVPSVFTNLT